MNGRVRRRGHSGRGTRIVLKTLKKDGWLIEQRKRTIRIFRHNGPVIIFHPGSAFKQLGRQIQRNYPTIGHRYDFGQ